MNLVPAPLNRRHDLDWIRVCAFGLLVLFHVGMYYVSWDWHVKSPQAGPQLEPFMLLSSPWRLSLLFLVSGVATAFLFERRAADPRPTAGFLYERSWRLLPPLVFGMLVIVPPQAYFELLDSRYPGGYHDGYLAFWARYLAADSSFCDEEGCLTLPTWNHLWFVAYLWVYTVILALTLGAFPHAVERLRARMTRLLHGVGVLLAPATLLALAQLLLAARFESTHAVVDDWYNHAQYGLVFALGFLIARNERVWRDLVRLRWQAIALAAAGYCFITWYFYGSGYGDATPHPGWLQALQRISWALNQWATIVAILGFAHRLRDADSHVLRYLTPAVFPVYILHQTLIVLFAVALRPLRLEPATEGPLLALATFAAAFAGYELIRRVPPVRPLFGLKSRTKAPTSSSGSTLEIA
jgi:surface polysaccharide O-acyltransferase-like enzyme